MRQSVGEKKVRRYRRETGLDVLTALVRGNTDHRIDLLLADGTITHWFKDGTLKSAVNIGWDVQRWKAQRG